MKKQPTQTKDLTFLKEYIICNKGIYNSKDIFENTLPAFGKCIDLNYIILTNIVVLKDNTVIVFDPTRVKELVNMEENLEKVTYEDLSYICKYHVPTLEELLQYIDGLVPIIFRLNDKYKRHRFDKVIEILKDYKGIFTIESYRTKNIKWVSKKCPEFIVGALLNTENYKYIHRFKRYDYIDIDIDLIEDKKIKKIKEDVIIIGNNIKNLNTFKNKATFYDNLVCDRLLEK